MHLHSLFDDCGSVRILKSQTRRSIAPSKGFIIASLAIVAQAPLRAANVLVSQFDDMLNPELPYLQQQDGVCHPLRFHRPPLL
jgi:hypothetical protein